MDIPTTAENREAGEFIARSSPEAAGLLVQIMDQNARAAEKLNEEIMSGIEAERDRWKVRALRAEAQIERIESRLLSILD